MRCKARLVATRILGILKENIGPDAFRLHGFFQIVSEKRRRQTCNGLMLQESSFSRPISDNRVRGKVLNQSFLLVPQFNAFNGDPP